MNDMNVPVCDAPQTPSIKNHMLSTQDYMLKTIDLLTAIRRDLIGGPEEKTQAPDVKCMLDCAEVQAAMAARITREVHDLATMLGVQV